MESEVVTFRCKRTAVSTLPVPPGTFHHLSVLDRAMEGHRLHAVYYYPRFPAEPGAGSTTGRLRESLSEALSSYPVATGRLLRAPEGHWVVKCNDAGVRVVEARARGSVQEWLQKVDRGKEKQLLFWEDMYDRPYFWSTFYVQLTEFEGGGLAIGMSCCHMLGDAAGLTMLVKAWADMTLQGKILSPPCFHPLPPRSAGDTSSGRPPCFDLTDRYKPAGETEGSGASCSNPKKFSTATFAFSNETARSVITDSQLAADGGATPTPFQAFAALFWTCISRVKGGRGDALVDMSICVDVREALNLSKSFFGNAMVFNGVQGEGIEEGRVDLAVKAVVDATNKLDKESVMDLVERLEVHKAATGPLLGGKLLCANWEGLSPYLSTFEPGDRPIHVAYYMEPVMGEGQVLVLPSPRGHEGSLARVVMVTLPEDQLDMLCEDVGIAKYHPEILMGPKRTHVI